MKQTTQKTAYFHLPGLFEFYELYELLLPLFRKHREYFYDWCEIGSIYGAPADCIWGGGRIGDGEHSAQEVLHLMQEYGISARLTFSNSLLQEEHLSDKKCNALCVLFEEGGVVQNGVIVHSDLLLAHCLYYHYYLLHLYRLYHQIFAYHRHTHSSSFACSLSIFAFCSASSCKENLLLNSVSTSIINSS